MKKISFSALFITAVVIIAIFLSSCSRKVGCYFSLKSQIESVIPEGYPACSVNQSERFSDSYTLQESLVNTCD